MYQDRYKERSVETSPGNSAIMFPESNVKMYPGNSVKMFHVNNVTKFHGNNVETFQNKNVETYPGNNAEMYQDKFVNKLVTAVNNFFDTIKENSEQSQAIITSPISIMLYQS